MDPILHEIGGAIPEDMFRFSDTAGRESSAHESIASLLTLAENMESLLPPDFVLPQDPSRSSLDETALDSLCTCDPYLYSNSNPQKNMSAVVHDTSSTPTRQRAEVAPATGPGCSFDSITEHGHPTMSRMPCTETRQVLHLPASALNPAVVPGAHSTSSTQLLSDNACSSPESVGLSSNTVLLMPPSTTSPCSVKDFATSSSVSPSPALPTRRVQQKTIRKPKTYAKPVASRFCHICSRMPRKGQGKAVCCKMQEGLCRKIVCEQCIREQGWDFNSIQANMSTWQCPHCAGVCPPRSQCHIYNRINARRKRAQSPPVNEGRVSLDSALSSTNVLLNSYGHLVHGLHNDRPHGHVNPFGWLSGK